MEQEQNKPPETPAAAAPSAAAGTGAAAAPAVAASAKIGIEDFAKVEMRVGQVKTAERVAGADRLLQLQVDIGDEVRQIVAGLALAYKPEELVGRKVVVVTNLQPRKLRGVESNGMIVAASTAGWRAGPGRFPGRCARGGEAQVGQASACCFCIQAAIETQTG